MQPSFALLFAAAAAVSGSVLKPRACAGDLCLRAVRATQRAEIGSSDCSSYWRTTVTPTVTLYETETSTESVTTYITTTETDAVHLTSVVRVPSTLTVNIQTTQTQTLTLGQNFFKRQDPGNAIPSYASACSGEVRYSSACSCIGITMVTVTASAPTTVVTISETTTVSNFEYVLVETSVTTLDATVTSPDVVSTSTVVTGPTATITMFALQIASGPQAYVGQYLKWKQYASDTRSLTLTTDATQADFIYLYSNGRISMRVDVWPGILYAGGVFNSPNSVIFQWEQNFQGGAVVPLVCSLAFDRTLNCASSNGYNTFGIAYGNLLWGSGASQLSQVSGSVVTLKAVAHV